MIEAGKLGELVSALYESALDGRQWSRFLSQYAGALSAEGAVIAVGPRLEGSFGIDEDYVRAYEHRFANKNVYIQRAGHLLRTGTVFVSQSLCPDSVLVRSEYYNEYLRPQNVYHTLAAIVVRDARSMIHVGAVRPKSGGAFQPSQRNVAEFLMPHFQTAMRLRARVKAAEARETGVRDLLDRLCCGILLLDGAGRVLVANRLANSFLRSADGLKVGGGKLECALAPERDQLHRLIRNAVSSDTEIKMATGGAMRISRSSGKLPYVVLVTPLSFNARAEIAADARAADSKAAAAVFISDPHEAPVIGARVLQVQYGLTASEARVAELLVSGHDVKATAERLGLGRETVRTHVKRALAKTGARRQADLVRICMSIPVTTGLKQLPGME